MIIGWDGLGISSFLLIIHYQDDKSINSAIITIFTNRLGDAALILLIVLISNNHTWFMQTNQYSKTFILIIIAASLTKSAQIPFSAWLPIAISAPTPISALVHSSTLVTAGVYLIIRTNYIIKDNNLINTLLIISTITRIISGLAALKETDIKKIIAFSTLNQISLIFVRISINQSKIAFFHLIVHAVFKSSLFICAGFCIHEYSRSQEIKYLKNLSIRNPFITSLLYLANISIIGFPITAGFISKHIILEYSFLERIYIFIYLALLLRFSLTIAYTFKITYFITRGVPSLLNPLKNFTSNTKYINLPIYILITIVIFSGLFINSNYYIYEKILILINLDKISLNLLILASLFICYRHIKQKKKNYLNKNYSIFTLINSLKWTTIFNSLTINLSLKGRQLENNIILHLWEFKPKSLIYYSSLLNNFFSRNSHLLILIFYAIIYIIFIINLYFKKL